MRSPHDPRRGNGDGERSPATAGGPAFELAEQDLADFLDNASVGFRCVSVDGIILWVNQAELDLLGYGREEYVGHHVTEFHVDRNIVDEVVRRLAGGEILRDYEARMLAKDGSVKHVSISSSVLFRDGKFVHTRCITRDISEQKRAEQALWESHRQLRTVTDALPTLVSMCGRDYRFWFANLAYERWFGIHPRTLIGKRPSEIFGELEFAAIKPHVDAALAGREVRVAMRIPYAQKTRDVDMDFVPLRDENAEVTGYVTLVSDTTTTRRAEREVQRAKDQLETILRGVNEGIATVDPSGRTVYANEAAARISGYPSVEAMLAAAPEEALGRVELFQEDGKPCPPDQLAFHAALAGEEVRDRLVRWRIRGEDSDHWSLVSASPVFDSKGKVQLAIIFYSDVTERIRRQEKDEILARATAVLAGSLDLSATLQRLARLVVPGLADWAMFYLLEENDEVQRFLGHKDPEKVVWAEELDRRWPPDPDAPQGTFAVMRSGNAELVPDMSDELLVMGARDAEHLEVLRTLGIKSYLSVPMRSLEKIVGCLVFISSEGNRRYGEADLALAQELADRAAMFVENARLFANVRSALASRDETLALLDTILATAPVGLAFFDHELRYIRINKLLADVNGVPSEQTVGRTVREIIPEPIATIVETQLRRVFETGRSVANFEFAAPTPRDPGVLRHWLLGYYPVRSANGEVLYVGTVVTEITDQKRAVEEREQLIEDLSRTVRFSEMFIGILGHDLRNPLAAITTAASLLERRAESDERFARPAARILGSADRMGRMIEQLLDFTRIRLGKGIPLEQGHLDLAKLCRAAIEELEAAGRTNLLLEAMGDPVGAWDGDRLSQLVSNLLGNAIEHGAKNGEVLIRLDGTNPEAVLLEVRNAGTVPADLIPVLFEPFQSGMDRKRRRSRGLGLGLYISQQIAVAHGGTIEVRSSEPEGTRFIVTLPRSSGY